MPGAGARMLDQLGAPAGERSFADVATPLVPGTKLPAPAAVFPRYVPPEAAAASA
jgi:methionyl-tRNA synthetase